MIVVIVVVVNFLEHENSIKWVGKFEKFEISITTNHIPIIGIKG